MRNTRKIIKLMTVLGASAALMATSACQSGSLTGSNKVSAEVTQIKFLYTTDAPNPVISKALMEGFNASQTKYNVIGESRPGGNDGDNLVKTRLATGAMAEVFSYNSGSLMNNLNPAKNLIPLDDRNYVKDYTPSFKVAVTATDGKVYGAPSQAGQAGGIMYNIKVYKELGLSIPNTWAEFMANSQKIKAAGKTAVIQSYGTDWTSQLFVLADFGNVNAADPKWAANYTANKAKYADPPALEGWQHLEDTYKAGFFNSNAASLTLDGALKMLATGDGVQYPILSSTIQSVVQNTPDLVKDIGFFPIPSTTSNKPIMTNWVAGAFYIPKTTTGVKLEAAEAFLDWAMSSNGCKALNAAVVPQGPYGMKTCTPTGDLSQVAKDVISYTTKDQASVALEFVSPLKGPNMVSIMVLVGTGQNTAKQAAALYDGDVKKEALQLGLPGW